MPTAPKKRTPATRRTAATRVAADGSVPPTAHDAIATRAYEMFLQRGAQHGQDWDDWLAAERELQQ